MKARSRAAPPDAINMTADEGTGCEIEICTNLDVTVRVCKDCFTWGEKKERNVYHEACSHILGD